MYIHLSLSLSLSIYIYIYITIYVNSSCRVIRTLMCVMSRRHLYRDMCASCACMRGLDKALISLSLSIYIYTYICMYAHIIVLLLYYIIL